jgi:hypothetical protein
MEVENKLELAKFELTDVVEVKTTADEAMAFSNSWWTYRERTDRLVRSRGKVYSLVLGQCTTVLLDKMKQDADWQVVSDSFDPLKLLTIWGRLQCDVDSPALAVRKQGVLCFCRSCVSTVAWVGCELSWPSLLYGLCWCKSRPSPRHCCGSRWLFRGKLGTWWRVGGASWFGMKGGVY